MDWTPGNMSSDIEDRRGDSGGGGFSGGGLGLGGLVILVIISLVTGRNYIGGYLGGGGAPAASSSRADDPNGANGANAANVSASPDEDRSAHLVSFVLDDVQRFWTTALPEQANVDYRHARLVLFRGATYSGCGSARSATGPFYCPEDEKVYIDLGFWEQLAQFGGSGEFAQAYVVAHELGHHVQNLLGTETRVHSLESRDPGSRNRLSVELELQADCFAGVWAHNAEQRNIIHAADIESGLGAAAAVGDDHIQKMERGTVSPETFTHGTSAQRVEWFKRGMEGGQISACDTFGAGVSE